MAVYHTDRQHGVKKNGIVTLGLENMYGLKKKDAEPRGESDDESPSFPLGIP
jgi:hypothetical protein